MELVLSILIGGLFAIAFYQMLRRSMMRLIIGLLLFGQAVNLLIFTAGGLTRGKPPIIAADAQTLPQPYADPLPQALILTAIVIGFGLIAFTLALGHRVHMVLGTDDLESMGEEEE